MARRTSSHSVPPRLPPGPFPWILVILLLASASTAYVPFCRTLFPLNYVYDLAILLLRTDLLYQILMAAAIVAHITEALYTLYLGTKSKVPAGDLGAWFTVVLVFGFPGLLTFQKAITKARTRRN